MSAFLNRPKHISRLEFIFIGLLILVFGVSAIAKAVGFFGEDGFLLRREPLTGLPYHQLFLLAALVEFIIVICLLTTDARSLGYLLTGAFAILGLAYHLMRFKLGISDPCACWGAMAAWSWLEQRNTEVSIVLLATFGFGSGLALWRGARASV